MSEQPAPGQGPGKVLDQYELLERLSTSRTGQVYKARHRLMGRIVAVKILSREAAASEILTERFHRTVKILSRMDHPNLVRVFEAGQQADVQYLAMEYVDGKDLRALVKEQGPLPLEQAVGYVLQAAAGLSCAHEQGVFHRNIKPSNLLVDRQGVLKIVGFGVAHVESGGLLGESNTGDNLTGQGEVVGTCDYMAPEQAMDSRNVDERADVYSLGCTLATLVTGRPPYPAKSAMQQVVAHRTMPVPSLRTLRPDVPEGLDRVFQKMLAKQPADRYASMKELIVELRSSLAAPPWADAASRAKTETAGAGPLGRGGRPSWRRPLLGPILTGAITALAAMIVVLWVYRPGRQPTEVAQPEEPAVASEQQADSPDPEASTGGEPASKSAEPPVGNGAAKGPPEVEKPAPPDKVAEEPAEAKSTPPDKTDADAPKEKTEPPTPTEPPKEPVEPGPTESTKPPAKEPAGTLPPVPEAAARERAAQLIRDTFQEEFENARSSEDKSALARKLLHEAAKVSDDAVGRFAFFETAQRLATEAADAPAAVAAVDCMARFYAVNAWALKVAVMGDVAKAARTSAQHRSMAEQAFKLTQQAMEGHESEAASRLSSLAVAEAAKARDPQLIQKVRTEAKEVERALVAFRQYEAAMTTLRQDFKDPEANSAAGRYECLFKGDWDAGLPKLAQAGDASLRAPAGKDLAGPTDPEQQVAVADGWWELARSESGSAKAQLYRRAALWYQKAASKATGLLKTKVERRLEAIRSPETDASPDK